MYRLTHLRRLSGYNVDSIWCSTDSKIKKDKPNNCFNLTQPSVSQVKQMLGTESGI